MAIGRPRCRYRCIVRSEICKGSDDLQTEMVRFDEGDVSYVSYLAIWSGGERRRLLSHIPNQRANSVRHARMLVLCSGSHDNALRWKVGQAILMESAGNIVRTYLAVLADWRGRCDGNNPEYDSRHTFGVGNHPRKHRQTVGTDS